MSEETVIKILMFAFAALPHAFVAAAFAFSGDRDKSKRAIAYLRQHPELCQKYRDSPKRLLKEAREKLEAI